MLYKLKELEYINKPDKSIEVQSPTHTYIIRFDELEKRYQVQYHERSSNKVGYTWCKTYGECKEWIEKTHLPAKLSQFFDKVSSEPTQAMINKSSAYINSLIEPPTTPVFVKELFITMIK